MNDFPKSVTIDLSNDPGLAAMLQALVVSREANRQQVIKAQEEYQARVAALPPEQQAMLAEGTVTIGCDVYSSPCSPAPKADLASIALDALRDGVAMQLQRHDVLGVHLAAMPIPVPRHVVGRLR